ncbi:MAG: MucB/RseB C-terminal domain-containing protein [Burkholderiaceae bacterium]
MASQPPVAARTVNDWLLRMHDASKQRAYIGTFVVSVGADMSSAKIWHVCDGELQMERVEALTGVPRSIFRRNNDVITFFPDQKVARTEQRESLGLFPNFLKSSNTAIADYYALKVLEADRVAGFETDVVQLVAKDRLRYSYRIWTERKSGLVVKLQTLDATGRVLEQAAFSELSIDAPVKMERLAQMMGNTAGHKIEHIGLSKTTALAQGWVLTQGVPGFSSMACYKRSVQSAAAPAAVPAAAHADSSAGPNAVEADAGNTMQWIFSDGLATVSLFVEVYDRKRHTQEGSMSLGATHTLTKRMNESWLTAVGEVPLATLKIFAQQLERKKQ